MFKIRRDLEPAFHECVSKVCAAFDQPIFTQAHLNMWYVCMHNGHMKFLKHTDDSSVNVATQHEHVRAKLRHGDVKDE